MSLLDELKRRNVIRVAIAYVAIAWLLLQVAEMLLPVYGFTDVAIRNLVAVLAIGFLVTLPLAWVFEWTPDGIFRESNDGAAPVVRSSKYFDRLIVLLLVVAVTFFAVDKFVLDPARDAAREKQVVEQARSEVLVESFGDKSIAVLPFVNMSADPDQVYFSDGIAEEILNLLAKIRGLRVISRSSAFAYRGEINIPEVAEALNVSYVLEGSVRKAGEQIRITAQLIDARSDSHVWSDTWNRSLTDIFAVQDEIAGIVAKELELKLTGQRRPRATDPQTYALYLQAKHLYYGQAGNFTDFSEPIGLLRRALERDGKFVPAMTLLANILLHKPTDGLSPVERNERMQEYEKLIRNAVEIDPDDAVASMYMGGLLVMSGAGFGAGLSYVERSLQLEPSNMEVLRVAGYVSRLLGRTDDAVMLYEQAIAREPLCIPCYAGLHVALVWAGRYDEAEAVLQRRIALVDDIGGHVNLAQVMIHNGRPQEALEIINEWEPDENLRVAFRVMALEAMGRREEADAALERLRSGWEDDPNLLAAIYAQRGDKEATLRWLEKVMQQDPERFEYSVWDPLFSLLHDTPQWQQWRKDAGLDEESLAKIVFTIPDFGN
jgi:adenylate cyclase